MNPIMNMFGNNAGQSIMMQAIGAAMRGESPQAFMKKLANSHPQLKRMDLDNLYNSAQQLCQERGLNPDEVAQSIDPLIKP